MRPLSFEFSHCVQIRVRQQLCIGFASVFPQKSQRFVVSGHAIALTFGHFTLGHNWDNKGERKKVKIQIPVLPSIPWDTCGQQGGILSHFWTVDKLEDPKIYCYRVSQQVWDRLNVIFWSSEVCQRRKRILRKNIFCSIKLLFKPFLWTAKLKMSHLCSPHKWPLKAIVVPNAKHEGYNWSFWRSRVVTKFNWSRVRTTQIPLFSLLTTSKSPHLP